MYLHFVNPRLCENRHHTCTKNGLQNMITNQIGPFNKISFCYFQKKKTEKISFWTEGLFGGGGIFGMFISVIICQHTVGTLRWKRQRTVWLLVGLVLHAGAHLARIFRYTSRQVLLGMHLLRMHAAPTARCYINLFKILCHTLQLPIWPLFSSLSTFVTLARDFVHLRTQRSSSLCAFANFRYVLSFSPNT